jgi:hypothetical protein
VFLELTILKHPLDVEAVGGTRLVVGALLEVGSQLSGAGVVNHARVVLRNGIWVESGSR